MRVVSLAESPNVSMGLATVTGGDVVTVALLVIIVALGLARRGSRIREARHERALDEWARMYLAWERVRAECVGIDEIDEMDGVS